MKNKFPRAISVFVGLRGWMGWKVIGADSIRLLKVIETEIWIGGDQRDMD